MFFCWSKVQLVSVKVKRSKKFNFIFSINENFCSRLTPHKSNCHLVFFVGFGATNEAVVSLIQTADNTILESLNANILFLDEPLLHIDFC